jgi:non-specific serine/threonine protein kinase
MDTPVSFGLWLRQRRRELDLTQDELARRASCSVSAIRKIEADERRPSLEVAELLATALAIDPAQRALFVRVARQQLGIDHLAVVTPLPWAPVLPLAPSSAPSLPAPPPAVEEHIRTAADHHLPSVLTSFVGRQRELAEVRRRLAQTAPRVRLLTLTGPGGTGKTRLALQAAAEVAETYHDGVWWVELAQILDAELLPYAVAAAVGAAEAPPTPLAVSVVEYLHSRHGLLVLDNCEHLVQACAELAGWLLSQCPHLQILATSREALQITGEVTLAVPPLALPLRAEHYDVQTLATVESVRLLAERARAVRSGFVITTANAAAVAEICRRLDGIPLALELAASRLRAMTPEQLAARLDDRFRVLTGGSRTALPRQRTLHALIEWSHELLSHDEQALFRRLSVFAGGWSLEAAEAVTDFAPLAWGDVLDLLTSLADKSLVTMREEDGSMRYGFLETIREFAAVRLLESAEGGEICARHFAHFTNLAEAASEVLLEGGNPLGWIALLRREQENVRAALEWAVVQQPGQALHLAGRLAPFWNLNDQVTEGHAWLARALDAAAGAPVLPRAWAVSGLGTMAWRQGDFRRALALHEEALELFRQAGDSYGEAFSLNNIGAQLFIQDDDERATDCYLEALGIARRMGATYLAAMALANWGVLALDRNDFQEAGVCLVEALAAARTLENPQLIGMPLHNLGELANKQGNFALAQHYFEQSLEQYRLVGSRQGIALNIWGKGTTLYEQGNYRAAVPALLEALGQFADLGDRRYVVDCLESLALSFVQLAVNVAAAQSLGAAAALRQALNYQDRLSVGQARYEWALAELRRRLGAAGFATAWEAGLRMTMDEAVRCALGEQISAGN